MGNSMIESFVLYFIFVLLEDVEQSSAGIFKRSLGAGNRVGIGLSFRPARLHSLAELVPWNRLLGFLKV
jgi:hypothetical protein